LINFIASGFSTTAVVFLQTIKNRQSKFI
jgi:hypothetical protein